MTRVGKWAVGLLLGVLLVGLGCGPAEPTAVKLVFFYGGIDARQVTIKVDTATQQTYTFPAVADQPLLQGASVGVIFAASEVGKTIPIEVSVTNGISIEPLDTKVLEVKVERDHLQPIPVCFGNVACPAQSPGPAPTPR